MLGPFHLLPFLKGWEYKAHPAERNAVIRGADPIEVLRIDETGWLFEVGLLTTDAYGSLMIEYQGGDLETRISTFYPEAAAVAGFYLPHPGGELDRYFRPDPNSTAGLYYVTGYAGEFGMPLPYVPTVIVKLHLNEVSTQDSAYIYGAANTIAITNKKLFIQSLRSLLGSPIIQHIDPALLQSGPINIDEKGYAEK